MKLSHIILIAALALTAFFLFFQLFDRLDDQDVQEALNITSTQPPAQLSSTFPEVDYSKSAIDMSLILSGGPGKDGIPAITDPNFVSVSNSDVPDDTLGVLLELDGQKRFYPFNILVWHEIVNDSIGDNHFAVTFCPLCGSSVVFDRNTEEGVVEFGVSGFLYESNMIMYDRTDIPTLWSQSLGSGIVGTKTGQALDIIKFQLLSFADVVKNHSDAQVMSTNTGFSRDYQRNPYGNYDETEELFFGISNADARYPTKEIFYIVPQNDTSVAIRVSELSKGQSVSNDQLSLTITKNQDGELSVVGNNQDEQPGYFEMWFSWATQHPSDGVVWDLSQS